MTRFRDKIPTAHYLAYEKLCTHNTHMSSYSRGRGERVYLCRCMPVIKLPHNNWLILPSKRVKKTNFQKRSKF